MDVRKDYWKANSKFGKQLADSSVNFAFAAFCSLKHFHWKKKAREINECQDIEKGTALPAAQFQSSAADKVTFVPGG